MKKFRFDLDKSGYGGVNSGDITHTIHLGWAFLSAPDIGTDSKAGTIVHELSHYDDIGGTSDFGNTYGVPASQALIPWTNKVLNHADSFEYYIEGAW